MPASLLPTATNIAVLPSACSASALVETDAISMPRAAIIAALPSATLCPDTVPETPLPVTA